MILYRVQPLNQLNIFLLNLNIMQIKVRYKMIITIMVLCFVVEPFCQVNNHLPNFHQTKISIKSMHQDNSHNPHIVHNYIFNYPLNFLKTNQITSVIFIHSMQWSNNISPSQINYSVKKFSSPTAMLITLSSYYLAWQNFDIGIVLNDFKYRPDLFFGEAQILNHQPFQKHFQYLAVIPSTVQYNKFISYLTGIQGYSLDSQNPQIKVDLQEQFLSNGQLRFAVFAGPKTNIQKVYVSYIACRQLPREIKKTGIFNFQNIRYQVFQGLRSDLPVSQHILFGISGIKFKQHQGVFKVDFSIVSQYVLQVSVQENLDYLKVSYFGISAAPSKACQKCGSNTFIYSEGEKNYCIQKCDSNTFLKQYPTGGNACIKCPHILNMTLPAHKNGCDCALGFFFSGNKCLSFIEFGPYPTHTFPNCQEPNMARNNQGQCNCKIGFKKNNRNECINICQNGLWNGFNCEVCQQGMFIREDIRQCQHCPQFCDICRNLYSCQQCKNGYFWDKNLGKCLQVCGDGRKFSIQCDDGNKIDEDGCSSLCKIQDGFTCEGGSFRSIDRCWRISFAIKKISQRLAGSSILLDYQLLPTPQTFYSQQQLKKMIHIAIEKPRNYPSHILFSHDKNNPSLIRIALHYLNLPNQNFEIQLRFVFLDGKILTQTVMTQFFQTYSAFNSRFNQDSLV